MRLLGIGIVMSVAGCASTGVDRAQATVDGLKRLETRLAAGEEKLDAAEKAARSLIVNPQDDLVPQYDAYVEAVAAVADEEASTRGAHDGMQSSALDYFEQWEADESEIAAGELKARSAQRRMSLKGEFKTLGSLMRERNQAVDALMAGLRDLERYLANNLSRAGLESVKDMPDKTAERVKTVKAKNAALVKELARVGKQISPAVN